MTKKPGEICNTWCGQSARLDGLLLLDEPIPDDGARQFGHGIPDLWICATSRFCNFSHPAMIAKRGT